VLKHEPGKHREYIGGVGDLWQKIGNLQLEMLRKQGLRPEHTLLDLGCGSLRLGILAIPFLNPGNYFGIDMHQSLIDAGLSHELAADLQKEKQPNFFATETFEVDVFATTFDFIIAQSVFTHLPVSKIKACIEKLPKVMHKDTKCFFTFYEFTDTTPAAKIDEEPYHQTQALYAEISKANGLQFTYIGDWGHPKDQKLGMLTLC